MTKMMPRLVLRQSRESDAPAIAAIYAHYVRHSLATFEVVAPEPDEIARRRASILRHGLPYLVAEIGRSVVGYSYASPYRTRIAYRFTVENSIYVHRDYMRKGIGRCLLPALIDACAAAGCRQMVAVIGDIGNAPSIGLHEAFGFKRVGLMPSVGLKFGRWVDCVLMQRALGEGDVTLPDDLAR